MRIGSIARTAVLPLSNIYQADTYNFGYIPIIMRTDAIGAMAGLTGSNGSQDGFKPVAAWSYVIYRGNNSDALVTVPVRNVSVYDNPNAASPNIIKWTTGSVVLPDLTTIHGRDTLYERIAVRNAQVNPDDYDSPIIQCGKDTTQYENYMSTWGSNSYLANALCITLPLTNTVPTLYSKYYDSRYCTSYDVRVECLVFGYSTNLSIVSDTGYYTRILTTYRESSRGGGMLLNAMHTNLAISAVQHGYTFIYGMQGLATIHNRQLSSSTGVTRTLDMFILNGNPGNGNYLSAGSRCIAINIYIGPCNSY